MFTVVLSLSFTVFRPSICFPPLTTPRVINMYNSLKYTLEDVRKKPAN